MTDLLRPDLAIEPKERPIPFTGDMVRATLRDESPKTQTRRVVRPQPELRDVAGAFQSLAFSTPRKGYWLLWPNAKRDILAACPYGVPGERLWVRESLRADDKGVWHYAADDAPVMLKQSDPRFSQMIMWAHHKDSDFCPPMFMPKFACRLRLELLDVRVERLQSISEADAIAEGARYVDTGLNEYRQKRDGWSMLDPHPANHMNCLGTARHAFGNFISTLSGKRRKLDTSIWDANPWVWALTFKRIAPPDYEIVRA